MQVSSAPAHRSAPPDLTFLRANNLPGWTQGGSSADNIVGQFAVSYHNEATALGIDLEELYAAMKADGEVRCW